MGRDTIEAGRFGDGQQQHRPLQGDGLDGSRNQHICVNDEAKGEHYRFGLWDGEALMI
jgi:hypothetical protein